jgi:hypothetical protein
MSRHALRAPFAAVAAAAALCLGPAAASASPAAHPAVGARSSVARGTYQVATILTGSSLSHPAGTGSEPLTQPDDITSLGPILFVAFQNGVGSMGEPSSTGNTNSTVVALTTSGTVIAQWDLPGKVDGMTTDLAGVRLIATVNEDGNSSLYTIDLLAPPGSQITHYSYIKNPLPHGGGTDAVTVDHGMILVSASAPTVSTGAAVYVVSLKRPSNGSGKATAVPLFRDNAMATPANPTASHRLALTDPDSNTVVPPTSTRFAGDFMLDSQGDLQQVYVDHPGSPAQHLSVLALSQSVDDSAWVTDRDGALFATDGTNDVVDVIRGDFRVGTAFTSVTPCNANSAPSTCPAPGFPPNYLGTINLTSGQVLPVSVAGVPLQPKGLLFLGF